MLNFDNNATTPVAPEVLEELIRVTRDIHGNSSSGHSIGVAAGDLLENCRKRVAKVLNAKLPSEIVFTSGGTESDNAAIRGCAWAMKDAGRGNHIITCAIEHRAVLAPCEWLAKHGYEVTVLGVDKNGRISLDEFKKALRPQTILVSVMLANNEIGTVQPIEQLGALARTHGFILHTDAVQVAGKLPIDVQALGVHALSLSAHKFYGPKGVGILYLRDNTPYTPFMLGGTHEYNKRAGTVAVPQIAAMTTALELVEKKRQSRGAEVKRLRDLLVQLTLKDVPGTHVNGDLNLCTPNTASLRFDGLYGGHLLRKLDDEGVLASAGSACMWEQTKPSHVLTALGLTDAEGGSTLRFSLGFDNTEDQVRELVVKLARLVPEIRKAPPQAIRPPKERVATH
ncbi:MAG: cysteine desulfurase [Planctomycetes bacterium]|nr:cysteine desulfurase [Planctomycetota bacterium]